MYAVQPKAWGKFDEWGADYTCNLQSAQRIAKAWGETCVIWKCGTKATFPLMTCAA